MITWDEYYYDLCQAVAQNSKCLSRKIGAIIVKDKSIVSTGYNGPPKGVPPCNERWHKDLNEFRHKMKPTIDYEKCPRYALGYKSGEGLDICVAGHAERNALINAARHGIATDGCRIYMDCGVPCTPCLIEIINAGISEIIVASWHIYDGTTQYLLDESKIKIRLYEHLQ
jgi:dCMP deaminase